MQLDNEEQRKLLLDIMKSINVPGQILEQVYNLKKSIERAKVLAPLENETIENGA